MNNNTPIELFHLLYEDNTELNRNQLENRIKKKAGKEFKLSNTYQSGKGAHRNYSVQDKKGADISIRSDLDDKSSSNIVVGGSPKRGRGENSPLSASAATHADTFARNVHKIANLIKDVQGNEDKDTPAQRMKKAWDREVKAKGKKALSDTRNPKGKRNIRGKGNRASRRIASMKEYYMQDLFDILIS